MTLDRHELGVVVALAQATAEAAAVAELERADAQTRSELQARLAEAERRDAARAADDAARAADDVAYKKRWAPVDVATARRRTQHRDASSAREALNAAIRARNAGSASPLAAERRVREARVVDDAAQAAYDAAEAAYEAAYEAASRHGRSEAETAR